jgi:hypothetical protein
MELAEAYVKELINLNILDTEMTVNKLLHWCSDSTDFVFRSVPQSVLDTESA